MAKTADDLLTAFRLGKESQRNFDMRISKETRKGDGGSPYQLYKPKESGPYSPPPPRPKLAGAPYSLNPQRMMLPDGRLEYAPLNLRTDEQKQNMHMQIYGGKWNKPIR
tara:strand:- start:353 stop:679 length:327 start_codon:yes stop_codon:yes gene_type:complete